MTSDQKVERIMSLVEAYRTSGGSAEHFAKKQQLRVEISALVENAFSWSNFYHMGRQAEYYGYNRPSITVTTGPS